MFIIDIYQIPLTMLRLANETTATNTTTNCQPLNCKAICTPSCNMNEVCILRTMIDCAICPASSCLSRTVLGLPPIGTSNRTTSSDSNNSSSSSTTGPLIGGTVGGLIGVGLLIGIGVYCYLKRSKNKGKLPFAFTAAGANVSRNMGNLEKLQQSPPPTPHPAVIAALSHQQPRNSVINNSKPIGLTEIATNNDIYTNNSPLYNQTFNTSNTSSTNNNNNNTTTNNNNTIVSTTTTASDRSSYYPSPPPPTHATIPEEFEERIAIQNKRISEILYNNPRLSQLRQQRPQLEQIASNRNSGISFTTTDDEYDYDDSDKRSTMSVSTTASSQGLPRQTSQIAASVQAVQFTRAKAQIMRVNSVRSSVATTGLSRSGSTKATLTAITPPSVSVIPVVVQPFTPQDMEEEDDDDDILSAHQFPSTPNNRSFADDPFHDAHSTTGLSDTATNDYWSNNKK
jgi:hypothetical protein